MEEEAQIALPAVVPLELEPRRSLEPEHESEHHSAGRGRRLSAGSASSCSSEQSAQSVQSIPASPSLSPRADRLHVRRQRRLSRVQIRKEQLCMCPDAAMAQINEIGLDDDDDEEAEDDGAGGAAPPPVADV